MKRYVIPRKLLSIVVTLMLAMLVAGVAALLVPAAPVGATHFRSTTLTWTKGAGNTANFEAVASLRLSYYGPPTSPPPSRSKGR